MALITLPDWRALRYGHPFPAQAGCTTGEYALKTVLHPRVFNHAGVAFHRRCGSCATALLQG